MNVKRPWSDFLSADVPRRSGNSAGKAAEQGNDCCYAGAEKNAKDPSLKPYSEMDALFGDLRK